MFSATQLNAYGICPWQFFATYVLHLAELGEPGEEPLLDARYLLNPRSTCVKDTHIHPFLSPDGTMAFFNSDESGLLQAYMIRGL